MGKYKFKLVMLTSGFSRRYGSNKLLVKFNGEKLLYQITLEKLRSLSDREDVESLVVVTRYPEIMEYLEEKGIAYIENEHAIEGISSSLKLGIIKSRKAEDGTQGPESFAYVFFVADQPFMKLHTMEEMLDGYGGGICCAHDGKKKGNPVIFQDVYEEELLSLSGDEGGRQIIGRHGDEVSYFHVEPVELEDIDEPRDKRPVDKAWAGEPIEPENRKKWENP